MDYLIGKLGYKSCRYLDFGHVSASHGYRTIWDYFTIVYFCSVPLIIVNSVTSPMIAELYSKKLLVELERTLRTIATLASIPSIIIFLIFVIFGRPILLFLFGLYYQTGYFALKFWALAHW